MKRREFLALGAASLFLPASLPSTLVAAPALEKKSLTLGVGGKALLYYLPLTIAERRGYFKDEGLDVEIQDFAGGAKSLQSLVGGSVDCVAGAYEHTIRMQAKGQDIRAVTELGRFPAIVICVRKDLAGKIKSAADFKGLKIGVTAPGSSTYIMAAYAMSKAGLKSSDASFIGVGAGASAVAAMKRGDIDVISHLDPVIAKLEADGDVVTLSDTRTEAGTMALFGGSNPAAVVYLKEEFIVANPNTTQALVNAFVKALKWLDKASPDDVAATVPPEYDLGDRPLYLKAVKASQESYSRSGIVPVEGQKSVYSMLKALDPELSGSNVDLSLTFDGRFVAKAVSG
jgi:NitT/TauT family transport system substrate-binding protein